MYSEIENHKPFENWLGFIGLEDCKTINVSPTLGPTEEVEEVIRRAEVEARDIAKNF